MIYRVWLPGPQAPSGVVADPLPSGPVLAALASRGVAPRDVRDGVVVAELTPEEVGALRSQGFEVALVPAAPKVKKHAAPEGFAGHGVPWPLFVVTLRVPYRPELLPTSDELAVRDLVGERVVVVRGRWAQVHALEGHPAVKSVTPLAPQQVVQRGLLARQDVMELAVLVDDRADLDLVVATAGPAIRAAPEPQDDGLFPPRFVVRVRGGANLARRLGGLPGVRRVERVPLDEGEDDAANCRTAQHQADVWGGTWAALLQELSLSGEGVRVGLWDYGLRLGSPHLAGVDVTGSPSNSTQDHATRVASVLVGRGAGQDPRGLGVAPAATLCLYETLFEANRVSGLGRLMREHDVRVVNVSRGVDEADAYSLLDQRLDREVRRAGGEELVLVFSSGNRGFPDKNSTLTKLPKNGILVGASTIAGRPSPDYPDSDSVWATSSAGPTEDNRRLPTVCAPGAAVWVVTQATDAEPPGLSVERGTSYAAPMVSGLLALLAEQRRREGSPPLSAAASRALLVAYARPMSGTWGPASAGAARPGAGWHPAAGWGAVDARALLRREADNIPPRRVYDQTAVFRKEGQRWTVRLQRAGEGPVRVVLAWTDAPGAVALTETLVSAVVNKLTLEVTSGGAVHVDARRILLADGRPAPDNLLVVDLLDPSESITVDVSAEALFADAIDGAGAPRQDFALVVTNAL